MDIAGPIFQLRVCEHNGLLRMISQSIDGYNDISERLELLSIPCAILELCTERRPTVRTVSYVTANHARKFPLVVIFCGIDNLGPL